ncbi:hypothetical protein SAMN05443550_101594 [Pedobacter hartonius]|uniref:Uncharacterized protein n=1 Tax=Pedobacter hartonius TaxID=425514 RepID=A0A1H3XH36_9SPHI|nr:hypothetical protein SAMN05443550_101594 [Pedobacter hartonius]
MYLKYTQDLYCPAVVKKEAVLKSIGLEDVAEGLQNY